MVFNNITIDEYKEIIKKHDKIVLFFKTMSYSSKYRFNLLFDFISSRYPDIKIIEIDIEHNGVLADQFDIDFLPTSIFIFKQKMIHQEKGIWDGGKNILSCFSNLVVHSGLYHSNKDTNINNTYKKKVEELNIELINDYLNYIEDK